MKKIVSLFLALAMVLGLVPAVVADEAPASDLLTITTEEITLRYASDTQDYELCLLLADEFMKDYPNITVEVLEMDIGTYADSLANLASTQNLPDVFWPGKIQYALLNDWLMCLDPWYAADPDAQMINKTILSGTVIGGRQYCVPMQNAPTSMIVNKTIFDMYNVELPSLTWTWEEYCYAMENVSHPEDYYYGAPESFDAGFFTTEWGWDGNSYTFEPWTELTETIEDWCARGLTAVTISEDVKQNIFAGNSASSQGHVAMEPLENYGWNSQAYLDGTWEAQTGSELLFYPMPTIDGKQITNIGSAAIAKSCKYPNEAWELMKYMGWGKKANLISQQYYYDNEIASTYMPVIDDEEVWEDCKAKAHPRMVDFISNVGECFPKNDKYSPDGDGRRINWLFVIRPKVQDGSRTLADAVAELYTKYNNAVANYFKKCPEFKDSGYVFSTATDLDIATVSDAE